LRIVSTVFLLAHALSVGHLTPFIIALLSTTHPGMVNGKYRILRGQKSFSFAQPHCRGVHP
jgi:hypothetical protein